jgi:hypothetical protein
MFGVKQPGKWAAFGLAVVFHVLGFGVAIHWPREPVSLSPQLVTPSIRLVTNSQELDKNTAQKTVANLESNDLPVKGSMSLASPTVQNIEAEPIASRSEDPNFGSIFSKSIHYFESNEVDNNSELFEDWVLRTQGVNSTALVAIQLTLYINEDGGLDKFVVLNSSLSDIETDMLLRDLTLTLFKPALKDEKPVPSQKNVEILLDPNPPTFRIPNFFKNFLPNNK